MFCFASICCDGVGFISELGHMFQAQANFIDVRNNGKNLKMQFFHLFFSCVISGFFWAKMQSQDVCFQKNTVPFQSLSTYIKLQNVQCVGRTCNLMFIVWPGNGGHSTYAFLPSKNLYVFFTRF